MSADYHPRTLYQAQPGSSLSTNRTPQLTSEGLSGRETILDSILQEARNGLSTLCQDYQIPPPPGTVSSTRRTEKEYHDPSDTPHRTIFEYSSTLGISPIANDGAPGKNLHLESNRGGFFEAPPIHHHPPLSNLIHGYTGHVTNDLSRSGSRLASGIGGASPDIAYGRHTHGFTEGVWKRGGPTSAHNTHVNPGNPVWERLYRHGTEKLVSRMSDVEVAEYREQVDLERQRKDLTFRPKICKDMERGGQTWKSGSRTARGADEHRSVDSGVEGTGSNAEGRKSTTAGRGHHMNIAHLARPLRDYSREIEQKNAREMKECTFRPQITPRSARRQQSPFSGRLYEDALARRKRVEELKEMAIRREQDKIQNEMANARQSAGRSTFANVPRYAGVWRAPPSNKTRTTSNHRRGSSMTSENYESNSMSRTAGTRSGHQRETTIPVNGINAASKPTTSHQNTLRRSSISTNNNVSMDATSHIRKDIENDPQNKPTIPTVDETSRHGTHILVDEQTQKSDNNMHASFEDMSRMNHSDIWPPRVAVPLIQTSETEAPYDSKNESITSATTPTGTTTFFTFKDEKTDFADSTRLGPVSEQDADAHTASVPQNNNPSTVAVSTLSVATPQNTTTSPTIRTITPAPPPSSMPMQSVTGRVSREAGENDSDLGTTGLESSVIFDTKFVERATDESTCRSWCEGEDEDVSFRLVGEATVEIANAARPLKNDAVMTDQS